MVSKTIDTSDNSWINLLKKKKNFRCLTCGGSPGAITGTAKITFFAFNKLVKFTL